jgi:glycosyltransferase involved in cell wall biosynthesis
MAKWFCITGVPARLISDDCMRVGLLIYALDRPLTGIGRYTLELARALGAPQGDLQVTLLAAGNPGLLAGHGFRRIPLYGCRLLPGLVTLGNALIPLLARRFGLDIVHDPTGVTPFLFGAGEARTVVTVHDVFAWSCPGTSTLLDTLIYRHWLPRLLPRVDAVITDSEASRSDIVRFLGVPPTRIRVIYPGVSQAHRTGQEAEVDAVRSRYGLPERYILFVGSVEERKNLRGLLYAYAHLRTMEEVYPLVVVGPRRRKGSEIQRVLWELGLEQHVIFAGYVQEADLNAVYKGADLFVFPSLYEGFGLPPLEAMSCGTPVVTSNVSSLPEVVGDAAIMVDPYDVEALAQAMRRALTDADLRAGMREKGRERATQFTWERAARQTAAVYRELCG